MHPSGSAAVKIWSPAPQSYCVLKPVLLFQLSCWVSPHPLPSLAGYPEERWGNNCHPTAQPFKNDKLNNSALLCLLTCTRPSLFSRVSLLPTVLLREARRSCTPLSQSQVVCRVSSKACCSCKVSWQLRSLSLTHLNKAWCWDCSWAETLVSLPSPRPPSFRACPSWQRRSNESLC